MIVAIVIIVEKSAYVNLILAMTQYMYISPYGPSY